MSRRAIVLALGLLIALAMYYLFAASHIPETSQPIPVASERNWNFSFVLLTYEGPVIGMKLAHCDGDVFTYREVYTPKPPAKGVLAKLGGWSLTIDPGLPSIYFLKCYRGVVYVGGGRVLAISTNGTPLWSRRLSERLEYPVDDIDFDGEHTYLLARSRVVKADLNLDRVYWAVEVSPSLGGFDGLSASKDNIYVYTVDPGYIIRLDGAGRLQWAKYIEVGGEHASIHAVYAEGEHLYVAGLFRKSLGRVHPFIAKLSRDGLLIWSRVLNANYPCPGLYSRDENKIVEHDGLYAAWISQFIIATFDEAGNVLSIYVIVPADGGYSALKVDDVVVVDGKAYLACNAKVRVRPVRPTVMDVDVEVRDAPVPFRIAPLWGGSRIPKAP